jgi:hypothetical protein
MPLVPAAPPQPVPVYSAFDYVTVDAQRRRVYAAHGGSRTLLVVDADAGTVVANIRVGSAHGVAYDPLGGHVFVGTGEGNVVEVDLEAKKVVRSIAVGGPVDAIAYDAELGRIYADEDNGTKLWVIDVRTFKLIATIALPGHKPEYLAIDPQTHEVYQNIADTAEVAIVDVRALRVRTTFKTPEISANHPLQFDPEFGEIVAGGNGVLAVYDRAGIPVGHLSVPAGIDQCDLDRGTHALACGGNGAITLVQLVAGAAPRLLGTLTVAPGLHTLASDAKTHDIWAVWSRPDGSGDFVQRFRWEPVKSS